VQCVELVRYLESNGLYFGKRKLTFGIRKSHGNSWPIFRLLRS